MSRTDGRKKPPDSSPRPSSPPASRGSSGKGRPAKGSVLDGVLDSFLKERGADGSADGDAETPGGVSPEIAALFEEDAAQDVMPLVGGGDGDGLLGVGQGLL